MIDNSIVIRKATLEDIDFIVETILEAEKSGTSKCGFANFFGLTELESKDILRSMLEEEIDGCEYSIDSYAVLEKNGNLAAAQSAWIEGQNSNEQPSSILKANLLGYYMPKENMQHASNFAKVIEGIQIERTKGALQFEYGYCKPEYRGNGFLKNLLDYFIENCDAPLIETQIFSMNRSAINSFKKMKFTIKKEYVSDNNQTLELFPYNKKVLLTRVIK